MDIGLLIAFLRQKQYITDLEKDILDTWDELHKNPLDCDCAKVQILKNNEKYPDVFAAVAALPTTVVRPFAQATEADLRYNLENQLAALAAKEGWQNYGK